MREGEGDGNERRGRGGERGESERAAGGSAWSGPCESVRVRVGVRKKKTKRSEHSRSVEVAHDDARRGEHGGNRATEKSRQRTGQLAVCMGCITQNVTASKISSHLPLAAKDLGGLRGDLGGRAAGQPPTTLLDSWLRVLHARRGMSRPPPQKRTHPPPPAPAPSSSSSSLPTSSSSTSAGPPAAPGTLQTTPSTSHTFHASPLDAILAQQGLERWRLTPPRWRAPWIEDRPADSGDAGTTATGQRAGRMTGLKAGTGLMAGRPGLLASSSSSSTDLDPSNLAHSLADDSAELAERAAVKLFPVFYPPRDGMDEDQMGEQVVKAGYAAKPSVQVRPAHPLSSLTLQTAGRN